MALQTFTPGQVLTAAQVTALQTNDFNQTVSTKTVSYTLVALDKGTRVVMNSASATTITVNTSLFNAGDTLFIHNIGAGVCTITAGTATVSTAGSLALATNAGGTLYFTSAGVAIFFPSAASSASGLTLINTTSFSGVTTQSFNNVFNATYTNYKILLSNLTNASAGLSFLNMRMRVGGVDASGGSTYNWSFIGSYGTVSFNTGLTAADTMQISGLTNGGIGWNVLDVSRPFLASQTLIISDHLGYQSDTAQYTQRRGLGAHSPTNSYDGFTIYSSTGNNIGGTMSIYGYNV